jgi:hypothetical protein
VFYFHLFLHDLISIFKFSAENFSACQILKNGLFFVYIMLFFGNNHTIWFFGHNLEKTKVVSHTELDFSVQPRGYAQSL